MRKKRFFECNWELRLGSEINDRTSRMGIDQFITAVGKKKITILRQINTFRLPNRVSNSSHLLKLVKDLLFS